MPVLSVLLVVAFLVLLVYGHHRLRTSVSQPVADGAVGLVAATLLGVLLLLMLYGEVA